MSGRAKDKFILFYNHTSIISGAEISLLEMLKEMARDQNVLLACPEGELKKVAEKNHIKVLVAPHIDVGLSLNPLNFLLFFFCTVRLTLYFFRLRLPIDVLYVNSIRGALGVLFAVIFKRVKLVVHIRDIFDFPVLKAVVRFLLMKFADLLIFNSEFTRDRFMDGTFSHKCRVLYSPVSYSFFRDLMVKDEGQFEGFPIISVIGQITPWKRQDFAIDVVKYLKERYESFLLLIVGDVRFSGRLRRYDNIRYYRFLNEKVKSEGLEKNIIFTGFRDDVVAILSQSHLLFLPSIDEPFGRVAAESLAVGTPVLLCSEGGMGRIIKENGAGYTFDKMSSPEEVAEMIISILENKEDRRERVIKGMLFAFENLTPFAIKDRLMEFLNEL